MRLLQGICINCLGCNKLEDECFSGINDCNNFVKGQAQKTDRHIEMCKRILNAEKGEQMQMKGV